MHTTKFMMEKKTTQTLPVQFGNFCSLMWKYFRYFQLHADILNGAPTEQLLATRKYKKKKIFAEKSRNL